MSTFDDLEREVRKLLHRVRQLEGNPEAENEAIVSDQRRRAEDAAADSSKQSPEPKPGQLRTRTQARTVRPDSDCAHGRSSKAAKRSDPWDADSSRPPGIGAH